MEFTKKIPLFDNRLPEMNHFHVEIHEGESFMAEAEKAADNTETLEFFVKTPHTRTLLHAFFQSSSLLSGTWALYEGTSKEYVSGNAVTVFNRYRSSSNTPQSGLQVCHTPSGSGDGTKLTGGFCGSGSGPQSAGGTDQNDAEIILKPNTAYLLRITSNANANQLRAEIDFYEHFDYNIATTTTTTTTTSTTTTTTT